MNNSNITSNCQDDNNPKKLDKDLIKKEFLEGSAISKEVAKLNLVFLPDVAYDEVVKEATDTPLDNALGSKYKRFTRKVINRLGVGFKQGYQVDNSVNDNFEYWQVKVYSDQETNNKKTGQYLAPYKIGNRVFSPTVPNSLVENLERKYNVSFDKSINFLENILNFKQIPIEITEGGKKALSLTSQGVLTISIYGCTCYNSTDLIPFLKDREIILTLDRDPSKSKGFKAVEKSIGNFHKIAKENNTKLLIRVWESNLGKGIDDLIKNFAGNWQSKTKLLTHKEYSSYSKLHNLELVETIKKGLKDFYKYNHHEVINADYLSVDNLLPVLKPLLDDEKFREKTIFNIKAGLGSNKTGSIIDTIKSHYDPSKYRVVVLVDINNLAYQTKNRFNNSGDNFGGNFPLMKHLHKDNVYDEVKDDNFSVVTCCIHSLLRFKDVDFKDVVLVLDESLSDFRTLIEGDTFNSCGDYSGSERQQLTYQILTRILKEAYHVYSLDGNLNNHLIKLISSLSGRYRAVNILGKPINPKKFDITMIDNFDVSMSMIIDTSK